MTDTSNYLTIEFIEQAPEEADAARALQAALAEDASGGEAASALDRELVLRDMVERRDERIAELEAQLAEMTAQRDSNLVDCLAMETQLAEAKAELREWIGNRGPKLAAEVGHAWAEQAEAENARLRELALAYLEAEREYRLEHDKQQAGIGLTLKTGKAEAELRAALQPDAQEAT